MARIEIRLLRLACVACALAIAGCGFHLRQSAALPAVMQQRVYLQVNGGGEFARALAAALRASKTQVLDTSTQGVATLLVPSAGFATQLLTNGGYEKVGEYVVRFHIEFTLTDASGKTVVPMQTIDLSHEFAIDQTQFSAIASETETIERSLVREMTDALLRRLQAQARNGALVAPASTTGSTGAPATATSVGTPTAASSAD